ncbi:MAG: rhodanese-like domain-containing protein [Bacilli bacterium]|nr:rhodanese-like domain-containing protein [Bacilli bacterium]
MKVISIDEYVPSMGILISLENKEDFKSIKGSINMDIDKILANPSRYLDKNKTYYFYCLQGSRSRRAVQILGVYGYKVVKVTI